MQTHILAVGLIAAVPLAVLLVATIVHQPLSFWPTAGKGTWQSLTFWFLFRTLNTAALSLPILDRETAFGLPWGVRSAGLAVFLMSGALYLYALFALGRDNTYCRRGGLVTDGVYRWTRNPQYATVIPAYAGLAVAADSTGVFVLVALLVAVYVLMAHAEEPWLRLQYGRAYERYVRAVPRFFNFRRAWLLLRGAVFGPARIRPVPARRGEQRTHKP
jgi:protein-S-isoprenylcysteine O-methyltransferase Ste14